MNIKITADSTCDLSEELLRQWNISLMPMHILMGDDTYLDGVTIHPADVFAHVDAGGQTPKSAAANPVEYIDFFEPFATEYDAVIHISVSAKLSSCYQNACLAAQEYANVSVIDSENICTGQGYLVLRAAKWAADGLTARNICMRLQSLANRVELSFVLNQLNYMAKSGRCSGVLAFGANILGIKPSLAIIDGELKVVRKYRGSLPICVGKYITDLLDGRDDIDNSMVFISSCQPKPGCMEAIKAGLRKYGKFENIIETDIGRPSAATPAPAPSASYLRIKFNRHSTKAPAMWRIPRQGRFLVPRTLFRVDGQHEHQHIQRILRICNVQHISIRPVEQLL